MILCRLYETIFIARPEADDEAIEKVHGRVLKALEQNGGIELKLINWGKRRLAYDIAGNRKGNYFYMGYIASPTVVEELQRQLKLSTDVIRYHTARLGELKPLIAFDIEVERKRVESWTPEREEDEEEQYLRRRDRGERGDRGDRGDRYDREYLD